MVGVVDLDSGAEARATGAEVLPVRRVSEEDADRGAAGRAVRLGTVGGRQSFSVERLTLAGGDRLRVGGNGIGLTAADSDLKPLTCLESEPTIFPKSEGAFSHVHH